MQTHDPDPQETQEWVDAFQSLVHTQGAARAQQILDELVVQANRARVGWKPTLNTPYVNTIVVD
jgi:pyruvate dehydrogenase E1 component